MPALAAFYLFSSAGQKSVLQSVDAMSQGSRCAVCCSTVGFAVFVGLEWLHITQQYVMLRATLQLSPCR